MQTYTTTKNTNMKIYCYQEVFKGKNIVFLQKIWTK